MKKICLFTSVALALATVGLRGERGTLPQYAPPDAYLPGEKLPYYGSDNPWDERYFKEEYPGGGRHGQVALHHLLAGRTDEAIAYCLRNLKLDDMDLESRFGLAIAYARKGRMDEAVKEMQTAVDLGLPLERLLAGPRDLLEPFRQTAWFKTQVAAKTNGLVHGPLLGAVTPTGARVWVRTEQESTVEVRVSATGDLAHPDATGTARSAAAQDYTAVVQVEGLKPATEYAYQVSINGQPVPRPPQWTFRTFPSNESLSQVRVAFGGCAAYAPANERMWDTIRLRQPDAFMLLGDNVYIESPTAVGAYHNYTYYCRQSRPEFRRLVASTPVYAIWDDHDAGMDDLFMGPYTDKPAWKPQYFELFRRNWNNPSYGDEPQRPGVWFKFRIGQAEFFMLDGRYYRENWLLPHPSMLGPDQKAWLKDALIKSTAMFKIIVSGTPWSDDAENETDPATGKPDQGMDDWHGFTEERTEIYDFLDEHKINGVLLLSGDRHRADLRQNERPHGYPLYELECSRLTNTKSGGLSGKALWAFEGTSFAMLTFDSAGVEPSLTMQVSNIRGEQVLQRTIYLREMRNP